VKNGHGLYTWPSGKKYDGEYKGGMKDGYGRMQWPDGQMYCGAWKQNRRHGRGIQSDLDGSISHCGLWEDDKPQGVMAEPVQTNVKLDAKQTSNVQVTAVPGYARQRVQNAVPETDISCRTDNSSLVQMIEPVRFVPTRLVV
jgi:hypothetical protein